MTSAPRVTLPFSPASFRRCANAAARILGLPVAFLPATYRRTDGLVIAEHAIKDCQARAYVCALSKDASAFSVEIDCPPTPDSAKAGMQAWRVLLELVHADQSANDKAQAFNELAAGIKPGGKFNMAFDDVNYHVVWIADTVIQLVANR